SDLLETFDPKTERLSAQPVITRYRNANANLRTQLIRIITAAGLKPWPKLFQNLRATRATEVADMPGIPSHVAAEWMGHSNTIADKHYRQVTREHIERALRAAPAQQQPLESSAMDGNKRSPENQKPLDVRKSRETRALQAPPVGLEPTTQRLTAAC